MAKVRLHYRAAVDVESTVHSLRYCLFRNVLVHLDLQCYYYSLSLE